MYVLIQPVGCQSLIKSLIILILTNSVYSDNEAVTSEIVMTVILKATLSFEQIMFSEKKETKF